MKESQINKNKNQNQPEKNKNEEDEGAGHEVESLELGVGLLERGAGFRRARFMVAWGGFCSGARWILRLGKIWVAIWGCHHRFGQLEASTSEASAQRMSWFAIWARSLELGHEGWVARSGWQRRVVGAGSAVAWGGFRSGRFGQSNASRSEALVG